MLCQDEYTKYSHINNQSQPVSPCQLLVDSGNSLVNINSIEDIIEHVMEEFFLQI